MGGTKLAESMPKPQIEVLQFNSQSHRRHKAKLLGTASRVPLPPNHAPPSARRVLLGNCREGVLLCSTSSTPRRGVLESIGNGQNAECSVFSKHSYDTPGFMKQLDFSPSRSGTPQATTSNEDFFYTCSHQTPSQAHHAGVSPLQSAKRGAVCLGTPRRVLVLSDFDSPEQKGYSSASVQTPRSRRKVPGAERGLTPRSIFQTTKRTRGIKENLPPLTPHCSLMSRDRRGLHTDRRGSATGNQKPEPGAAQGLSPIRRKLENLLY